MTPHGRRRNHSGVRAPVRQDTVQVVAWHQYVGIGHDDQIVVRGTPALDHVVELRIGTDAIIANEDIGFDMRMRRDQVFHQWDGGIVA
jgi:hypothetical protein